MRANPFIAKFEPLIANENRRPLTSSTCVMVRGNGRVLGAALIAGMERAEIGRQYFEIDDSKIFTQNIEEARAWLDQLISTTAPE